MHCNKQTCKALRSLILSSRQVWITVFARLPLQERNGLPDSEDGLCTSELRTAISHAIKSCRNWSSPNPASPQINVIRSDNEIEAIRPRYSQLVFEGRFLLEYGVKGREQIVVSCIDLTACSSVIHEQPYPEDASTLDEILEIVEFSHREVKDIILRVAFCFVRQDATTYARNYHAFDSVSDLFLL